MLSMRDSPPTEGLETPQLESVDQPVLRVQKVRDPMPVILFEVTDLISRLCSDSQPIQIRIRCDI